MTGNKRNLQFSRFLAFMSIATAAWLTLFPFVFSKNIDPEAGHIVFYLKRWGEFYSFDFVANIFFFIPLGFSLTYFFRIRSFRREYAIFLSFITCLILSVMVETLQIYLPSRYTSLMDVLSNVIGGALGSYAWFWKGNGLKHKILHLSVAGEMYLKRPAVQKWAWALIFLLILFLIPMTKRTTFTNWNPDYPVVIKNEKTGDRFWKGRIKEMHLFSKADFENLEPDTASAGTSNPAHLMTFRNSSSDSRTDARRSIIDNTLINKSEGEKKWLESRDPATAVNRKIIETNQIAFTATVATSDTAQAGPARIFSISTNPYLRNFTIGQEAHALVVRLRTPLTGENAMKPEYKIEGVFADTAWHTIDVRYNGSILSINVDGGAAEMEQFFSPGTAFYGLFFNTHPKSAFGYVLIYLMLIALPLGIISSVLFNGPGHFWRMIILSLLTGALIEFLSMTTAVREPLYPHIFYFAAICILTYVLSRHYLVLANALVEHTHCRNTRRLSKA